MTKETIEGLGKDEITQRWVFDQTFAIRDPFERQEMINALAERAKELKVKRAFDDLLRIFKEKHKEQKRVSGGSNRTEFGYVRASFDDPEFFCGSWIANQQGVFRRTEKGDLVACYHPILPVERLTNMETKTEKIKLAYKRAGKWHDITVDKAVIASASKIVSLAQYGIAVTSETARYLVSFLSDVENLNDIPERSSTSKLGWKGAIFVPYDVDIISFDNIQAFRELLDSISERGSYDTWLELVRSVRANKAHPEPQLYMAASFASVLVPILNMLPFVVNLWGATGTGKTVALMMAASIWADPGNNHYITDSYATQNAFEIRLDILNHFPLLMDDMSKVRDRLDNDFTDLIYLLCSGKGKDRSNVDLGLNKVKTWQNTILSNMERPLATESMKGGAINRILDFEIKPGYIFPDGNKVVEILKGNYGFAGHKWVDIVLEHYSELEDMRRDFERRIKDVAKAQGSTKEEKQILPLSLLLLADKLATDYIFEDGIYLDIEDCVSQLKDIEEVSEGKRAYETIMDLVGVHENKFCPNHSGEYQNDNWGFIEDGYVNINPSVLKKFAKEHNFSVKAFCSWAKKKHLLRANSNMQNVVRIGTMLKRFYTIKLEEVVSDSNHESSESIDGFMDVDAQNDIPFD